MSPMSAERLKRPGEQKSLIEQYSSGELSIYDFAKLGYAAAARRFDLELLRAGEPAIHEDTFQEVMHDGGIAMRKFMHQTASGKKVGKNALVSQCIDPAINGYLSSYYTPFANDMTGRGGETF